MRKNFNLSCKKEQKEIETNTENETETSEHTTIDRTDSYIESVNSESNDNKTNEDKELEICDKLAEKLESFFTSIFFVSFIIYSAVVFNHKP